ncbi:hypothetical protein AQ616_06560 [Oceanobacillus sp. E9]|uniref:hypothetical protein n=1 Tax=Oceanobacillus TaxID=182709 RepID=UPI00084E4F8D|nr:hypothetical protein [Oceanobacillus sp. E9]OEH55836.1 hypothetical protein AQ616_06560 [Oceanobacillus sp. E9]
MKKKIFITLLIVSVCINIYFLGKWLLIDQWYVANEEDETILGEMVVKAINSNDYRDVSESEQIISIKTSVDRNKGGVFPYHYDISVLMDKQTHIFSCEDDRCTKVEKYGEMYSNYRDERSILPLGK